MPKHQEIKKIHPYRTTHTTAVVYEYSTRNQSAQTTANRWNQIRWLEALMDSRPPSWTSWHESPVHGGVERSHCPPKPLWQAFVTGGSLAAHILPTVHVSDSCNRRSSPHGLFESTVRQAAEPFCSARGSAALHSLSAYTTRMYLDPSRAQNVPIAFAVGSPLGVPLQVKQ